MPPIQAGAVLHDLAGPKQSYVPFLILLAIIFCGPIYFAPQYWYIGFGGFALFALIYVTATKASAGRLRPTAICEKGVVVSERGVETVIPWNEVQSVSLWTHRTTSGYDINARNTRFRLDQGWGKGLKAVIETVVAKAPLEWVHENFAVRPEKVGEARAALDKIMAKIGR